MSDAAFAALRALLGPRFTTDPAARSRRAGDESYHPRQPPLAVATPDSTDEVAAVVAVCKDAGLPIVPYGTGTAVEGGAIAAEALCLDLGGMDRVIAVHQRDMDASVEAGLTRLGLNRHLEQHHPGLYFSVDPGADASLGGMAATRASGSAAIGYGTMRDNVLGLTAVLADGQVIRTGGRARKSAAGYDLTRLLVGSEGTLAIITEVTLRLARRPRAVAAAVCAFPTVVAAADTAIDLVCHGLQPARLELLDAVQMEAIRRYSGLDHAAAPTLFIEFHGTQAGVDEAAALAQDMARGHGGTDFRWASDADQRQRLWQARYDAYHAARALRPGAAGYVTDVCVPIAHLATAIEAARRDLKNTGLTAPILGHVGDGNFHVVCLIDPEDAAELQAAQDFGRRLVDQALDLGGTCTGEHGIGLGKKQALARECGPALEAMRAVKRALDPDNLFNPGKVLDL